MNYRKIFTFLLLCFGMSWSAWYTLQIFNPAAIWVKAILALAYIWGPGLAAIITHTFIYGEALSTIGYVRKRMSWRAWLLSRLGPVGVLGATLGIIYMLGNVFHIPGFGKVIFSQLEQDEPMRLSFNFLRGLDFLSGPFSLPFAMNKWQALGLFLVMAWVLGSTLMAFVLRGQELAWRGFLIQELKSKGFLGSNLMIGGIWGAWSLPPLLVSSAPIGEVMYHGLFLFGYCISISFPLAYMSLKTQTIRSTSVFRGILGILGALVFLMTWDTDMTLGGVTGMAGMWIFLIATFLILVNDLQFVDNYSRLGFEEQTKDSE